jgi:hypothetical protein
VSTTRQWQEVEFDEVGKKFGSFDQIAAIGDAEGIVKALGVGAVLVRKILE